MSRENKSQYAILGILADAPRSGYEIKKLCDQFLSFFWNENYGNIYPALKKMEAEGLVTMERMKQDGSPDKKVYTITEAGHTALKDWLRRPPDFRILREELLLQIFFGQTIGAAPFREKIERQKKWCQSIIDRLNEVREYVETEIAPERQEDNLPYWLATLRFGLRFYQMESDWCDEAQAILLELAGNEND
ncbi:MAG: hypothetical protein B0D92_04080 [Spirochaeta sp. LUC14_002_19_P3]|nr:MAG: hypothetical protein B0D92_04080 [Spirochaeta sp. LUC14_002_19_P3]